MYEAIRGKEPAAAALGEVRKRVAAMDAKPSLAVVLVGKDPASEVYVRKKVQRATEIGMIARLIRMDVGASEKEVLSKVDELNDDEAVHGFIVQSPLPPQIDYQKVLDRIDPDKDVDGWTSASLGRLVAGKPGFRPATPLGVMRMLEHHKIPIKGKDATVVGRSNVVGKPMALMLLEKDATLSVCHSGTRDLKAHTEGADILVSAVGRPGLITADMVKEGSCVIDIGTTMVDGKLKGDADFDSIIKKARCSPVPGGVGPMTVAMLLSNVVDAAQMKI